MFRIELPVNKERDREEEGDKEFVSQSKLFLKSLFISVMAQLVCVILASSSCSVLCLLSHD